MNDKQAEQIEPTITVKQLRHVLFQLSDQNMTVAELRKALFDIRDQDAEIVIQGHAINLNTLGN